MFKVSGTSVQLHLKLQKMGNKTFKLPFTPKRQA